MEIVPVEMHTDPHYMKSSGCLTETETWVLYTFLVDNKGSCSRDVHGVGSLFQCKQ